MWLRLPPPPLLPPLAKTAGDVTPSTKAANSTVVIRFIFFSPGCASVCLPLLTTGVKKPPAGGSWLSDWPRSIVYLQCVMQCNTMASCREAMGPAEGQRAVETPPRLRAKSASSVGLVGPPASLRGRGLSGALAASGFDGIRRPVRWSAEEPCPARHTPTPVSAVSRRFPPAFPGRGREKPNQEKSARKTPASP